MTYRIVTVVIAALLLGLAFLAHNGETSSSSAPSDQPTTTHSADEGSASFSGLGK